MTSVAVLGATGSLGRHVAGQAVARGSSLALLVRSPQKLAPDIASGARVTVANLAAALSATLVGVPVLMGGISRIVVASKIRSGVTEVQHFVRGAA
jgi:uncharacterized protein YbjT (DUF2867 family)